MRRVNTGDYILPMKSLSLAFHSLEGFEAIQSPCSVFLTDGVGAEDLADVALENQHW